MDPLTHALVGAAVGWAAGGRRLGRRALAVGAVAGLLPDLDVFIRSASDPLLAIEHHRGFTHSFALVPAGGVVAALLAGGRHERRAAIVAGMLAYLTHPLLDAATTYGTQLFWPLLDTRVGLDIISIVDPIFTLIALIACIAAWRDRPRIVHAALALALVWLGVGFVQRERASAAQMRLAAERGDRIERAAVFPTIGNTLVWRSLYATNGTLRMDRIRVPWLGATSVAEGPAVPDARPRRDATAVRDLRRFVWFSDGWIARDPADASLLGDARYSLHAGRYAPVWGIRLRPRTEWVNRSRERRVSLAETWAEIAGTDPAFRVLR
ncbi:MAG TPA: metal-dependent hydrolase [Thermoanaerobaculia bacterium]|nr:metal-dependent hydrolase [Thermoanaerobaculia bacterium]